ncbi:DUF2524 family protein [Bacillus solimangrovi]|uniref:DUF2524 domain-containing protein n=1 Tax=Bacillus solimangrovi TaxID=1305675 RepID=A0A1E5LDJ8_9BACI|nr:DUF2524 family protein [Bacillus solimangrovi]OEH92119.1 hypothetical protein BFG57_16685 [Bacillus solimangrovi]
MGVRSSIEEGLRNARHVYENAYEQLDTFRKQEHYNQTEYSSCQRAINGSLAELEILHHSGNAQQKDQLSRMQMQLRQLQSDMILDENDVLY